MTTRTLFQAAALGMVLAAVSAGFASPATNAESSGHKSTTVATSGSLESGDLVTSSTMSGAITAIDDFVAESDQASDFAVVVQTGSASLQIRWKGGKPPAELTSLLSKRFPSLVVSVQSTAYSAEEIDNAIHELMDQARAKNIVINSLAPQDDFSGILVGVPSVSAQVASENLSSPIPLVYFRQDGGYIPTSRRADTPPFWGSIAVTSQDGDECTAGIPVIRTNGTPGLLTAYHCGIRKVFRTFAGGTIVGTSGAGDASTDGTIIQGGASYGQRVYDGAYNSTDSVTMTGMGNPAVNQGVCFDGAFEGRHCTDVVVIQTGVYANIDGDGLRGPGFWARRAGAKPTIGSGDSGSPVFDWSNGAQTTIAIRGLAVGVSPDLHDDAQCAGSPDLARICSVQAFSINITALKNQLGFTLNN